jgi:hypothetical protein
MHTLYEIELDGTARGGEPYFHSVIVQCDDFEPAGLAPIAVSRHARLLRDIAGPLVRYSIHVYTPVILSADRNSESATSIGPLDEHHVPVRQVLR